MFLNKNGFGLKEMLFITCVLMLFLMLAVYNAYTIHDYFKDDNTKYLALESKLLQQSEIYLNNYYDGVLTSDGIVISNDFLKNYDLDTLLVDNLGNTCRGYVIASKSRGKTKVLPYISCEKYMTNGFEDWRL